MTRLLLTFFLLLPGLLRLSYTDIKAKELEHAAILTLLPAALLTDVSFLYRSIAAVTPFIFYNFYGLGDILMLSALGFVFGPLRLVDIFATASLCSGAVCIVSLALGKIKKEDTLPFAPYIAASCLLFLLKDMLL